MSDRPITIAELEKNAREGNQRWVARSVETMKRLAADPAYRAEIERRGF